MTENRISMTIRESIRRRPGMWIGALDERGLNSMLEGFFVFLLRSSAGDSEIVVSLEENSTIIRLKQTLLNEFFKGNNWEMIHSLMERERGIFDDHEGGYHVEALIHLSERFVLRYSQVEILTLVEGELTVNPLAVEDDFLEIEFELDSSIFKTAEYRKNDVVHICEKLSALGRCIHFHIQDFREGIHYEERIAMPNGLVDLFSNYLGRLKLVLGYK